DLQFRGRHDGEQSVSVGNPKRLEQPVRQREDRIGSTEKKSDNRRVEDDAQNHGFDALIYPESWRLFSRDRTHDRESHSSESLIVEQQYTEGEDYIVEKSVVGGCDDSDLQRGDEEEAC